MIDVTRAEQLRKGKHAFITRTQPQLDEACSLYGRDSKGKCLKVFYSKPLEGKQTVDDALWGDSPLTPKHLRKNTKLIDGSQIQNILWWHGISPRVYAVFEVKWNGKRVACQLTDFADGDEAKHVVECYAMHMRVQELGKQYGFKAQKGIINHRDIMGGKFVDPQPYAFEHKPYLDYVKKVYGEKGRYGKVYYQDEPRIGLTGGPRKSLDRIKYMKLDRIDFKGKVVWDVGCATGFFCRYAVDRGAKRVIGLDMKDPLEVAFHVGNLLKYFNIDYVECDLKRGIPVAKIPRAEIALFLSMNYHVPIPQQLLETSANVVFEDNGKESRKREVLGEPWTKFYNNIEFVGRGKDHGDKAIYHLFRK